MTIKLFDPQWVIERLQVNVPTLREISGAAQLARAAESLKQTPAAYVIPSAERASASNTGTEYVRQTNTVKFGVVIALQNLRDPRGDKAQADLLALRTSIMRALHGWEIDEHFTPLQFDGGRLMQLNDQVLWWQDDFTTTHFLRSI